MSPTNKATPRAGRREWIGLAVIALPCLLYSMDLTVLNLAIPSINADLHPTASEMLWIIDVYGFCLAGSLITMGALGDRIGRRRLLLFGAAAFGSMSIVAAFSNGVPMLIISRAALGIAGATLAPSTLSLIRHMFLDDRQRTTAIGIWVASYSAGAAIGPILGGLLLQHFWWGSVFLIGLPVMLVLLIAAPRLLPEFREADPPPFDITSAVMSVIAVLSFIFGLKLLAQNGINAAAAVSSLIGLIIGIFFIRRQLTVANALIDSKLFRSSTFRVALMVNAAGFLTAFGFFLFISQYLQIVRHQSPLMTGILLIPSAMMFIICSTLTPHFVRHLSIPTVIASGFLLSAIGFSIVATVSSTSPIALIITGECISDFGLAAVVTLVTDVIVGSVSPERAGAASAVSETSSELGGAMGIALLGALGTAVFRANLPSDSPSTLSDAVALSHGSADVYSAFVTSFDTVALVAAVFSLLLVPVCLKWIHL